MLFYALDRWFIKLFFSVDDFAYYSFAISIMSVINLLINAVSVTFYNYLAKNKIYGIENLCNLKNIPTKDFKVYCLPIKVEGIDAQPARVLVEF